jgi:hypothetical protein
MIVALDDEPLFHPVVWACRDIILQMFPCLDSDLIHELLKARDLIRRALVLPSKKNLARIHQIISPRLIQPPYLRRIIGLPYPTMRMERDEVVPHPDQLYEW